MKIEEKKFRNGYSLKAGDNYIELAYQGRWEWGYSFRRFKIADTRNKKLLDELRKRFYNFAETKKCYIQCWDNKRHKLASQFMAECGLKIKKSKPHFEKNLDRHVFLYKDIFSYRSAKETGLKKFYETFRYSGKYMPRTFETFTKSLDSILRGGDGATDNWQTIYLKNNPVGILMPYKTLAYYYKKLRPYGTLIYIGLVPEERGKGYGKIVFSRGLMFLKEMGLTRYMGSTESTNHAMLRVFKINNCRRTMTQHYYAAK